MSSDQFERLYRLLPPAGLDAVALNPGPSLTYLTGLGFHLMERPTVLLASPDKPTALVVPQLEMAKVQGSQVKLQAFPFGDDPATWGDAFVAAARALGLDGARIGVEPARMRVLELRFLEAAMPNAQIIAADAALSGLRMQKDSSEVAAMREAVRIAQRALQATLPVIRAGITEQAIASELMIQLLRAGTDAGVPFGPIVSGGPHSADPHASPSERPLQEGDMLVIDWGASYHGYISDLTRTFAIGDVEPEYERIHALTLAANEAGRKASRPGIAAGQVDAAARAVIEAGGYGPYFFHRVGHGIGMEGHEPPYMFGANPLVLEPGMAFTVEPGIYLPERGGVRIEDNVVITGDGAETLSDMARDLTRLGP